MFDRIEHLQALSPEFIDITWYVYEVIHPHFLAHLFTGALAYAPET